MTSTLIYFMIIAMPFFLVRVLAVVWNILLFEIKFKTWVIFLLCPEGAHLDEIIDSPHLTLYWVLPI